MKLNRISLLTILFLYTTIQHSVAQERGMKPIQVTIDGTATTLYNQSHALLIGISAYNAGLPPLPGVVGDINAVKTILENNGFNVITVMNQDNAGLQRAFTNFIAQYGKAPNNRLLIYFAGHGYTEKMSYGDDIGYICPVDTPDPNKNPTGFQQKAMPMRQIETYAYQINSKHALFLFDACFSGSIFFTSRAIPEVITYKTKEPVRQFITSGSANETVPDKSIFRDQFIRALKGEADGNKDGYLTGTELGEFMQSNVINYSYGSQHPQYGKIRNANLDKGDFVFVLTQTTPAIDDLTTDPAINEYIEEVSSNNEFGGASGSFIDERDGQEYKWVKIGKQIWMAKNLQYETNNCSCYENNEWWCKQYGHLYNWYEAQTACPKGWHLPKDDEWIVLEVLVDSKIKDKKPWSNQLRQAVDPITHNYRGHDAGDNLKSENVWGKNKSGTNKFHFSALPAGYRYKNGKYKNLEKAAFFWTSTNFDNDNSCYREINELYKGIGRFVGRNNLFMSVRCIKN